MKGKLVAAIAFVFAMIVGSIMKDAFKLWLAPSPQAHRQASP